ncbi:MAG TPA: glycosyltransferase family 4 protein [Candidatus Binatia bacterium]|nr:glycosyltransferase family 4 protein [Candidatus Binatia bacterium]
MNLLFVNPTFRKWGGVEEVLVLLSEHFRRLGHRVVLASEDTRDTLRGRFHPDVVHHSLRLRRTNPWVALRNFAGLLSIARRERIDLISSHQTKTTVLCTAVGRLLGIPVVHTMHTWRADWRVRWLGFIGRNAIANSDATRDQLVRAFGLRPEAITLIRDVPPLMSEPSAAAVSRVREEFGVSPDQPLLVCLGRLTEDKGHIVLLRAMPEIRREFPSARLLVVGKGHLRSALTEQVAAMQLADCVTLTGYREDANAILAAATVAVLPSLREAYPLTNIECLRLGIPLVSTAVDGIPELVKDGENGVLVPPANPPALAEAVCGLLRDPALARRFAEAGRAQIGADFSPIVMCQRYEAYFASLVRRDGRPELGPVLNRESRNVS